MIKDIKLFEYLMNKQNYNYTSLANSINMELITLTSKVKRNSNLTFSETVKIGNLLKMTESEFLACFY